MQDLSLYNGPLPTTKIYTQWENIARERNCGALCVFTGIVRQEESKEKFQKDSKAQPNTESHAHTQSHGGIDSHNPCAQMVSALSFEVYEPLLYKWFQSWQAKAKEMGALLLMAHSVGDVSHTQSSYMCAVISRQRRVALALYEEFIEDFKANAPIWKYDIINGEKVFALSRSMPINGSGVLG